MIIIRNHFSNENFLFSAKKRHKSPEKADPLSCAHCGKSANGKGKLKKKPYCSTLCVKAANAVAAAAAATNGETPVSQQNGAHKVEIKTEVNDGQSSVPTSPSTSARNTSALLTNGTNGTNGASSPNSPLPTTNGPLNGDAKKLTNDNAMEQDEPSSYLVKWSVEEVCGYIRSLAGYSEYADDFAEHEIDGQALVLLNENHLVQTMNIKLGPALKIMSKIEAIKNNGPPIDQQ